MNARSQSGQALILAIGGAFVVLAGAVALVAIAGAVTGKGRAQRAADLAAISAARSLRDDLPRLLAPARLANGLPNPAHLDKATYLVRARFAGLAAARSNGVDLEPDADRVPGRRLVRPGPGQGRAAGDAGGGGGAAPGRRPRRWRRRRPRSPPRVAGRREWPAAAATAAHSSIATARA